MSAKDELSRRGFIAGAVAAGGGFALLATQVGALAGTVHSGAGTVEVSAFGEGAASVDMAPPVREPGLFLFGGSDGRGEHNSVRGRDFDSDFGSDSTLGAKCRAIADERGLKCASLPITGDRVRFATELFAPDAPEVIAGASTYADFIVLTGTAAEHGYRVIEESPRGALTVWKIARPVRPISSG